MIFQYFLLSTTFVPNFMFIWLLQACCWLLFVEAIQRWAPSAPVTFKHPCIPHIATFLYVSPFIISKDDETSFFTGKRMFDCVFRSAGTFWRQLWKSPRVWYLDCPLLRSYSNFLMGKLISQFDALVFLLQSSLVFWHASGADQDKQIIQLKHRDEE